jgi:hypothetical protein
MSRFLPSLADTIQPIRALTRKEVEFVWTEECETAFQTIKEQITKAHVLKYFDPAK